MFQSPGQVAFSVGPLSINWYGILIALGILSAYAFAIFEARRRDIKTKEIEDMVLWLVLAGVLGARLYYVVFNLDYFLSRPQDIIAIWKGGLAIHGALLGGALAFLIFMRRRKLSWLLYSDLVIPGIVFAQAIGRWGNFFNNEAFGRQTDLPWAVFIPEGFRPESLANFETFHPTFLYESLWDLAIFIFLVILARKVFPARKVFSESQTDLKSRALKDSDGKFQSYEKFEPYGILLFLYLMLYSCGRFFIESLRVDSLMFASFRVAQIMSIILFLTGLIGMFVVIKKHSVGKKY